MCCRLQFGLNTLSFRQTKTLHMFVGACSPPVWRTMFKLNRNSNQIFMCNVLQVKIITRSLPNFFTLWLPDRMPYGTILGITDLRAINTIQTTYTVLPDFILTKTSLLQSYIATIQTKILHFLTTFIQCRQNIVL